MQPMFELIRALRRFADAKNRVFALSDLRALLPGHQEGAFKSVLTRLEQRGELIRVCRGMYILPESPLRGSRLLGQTAASLRAGYLNYVSLETALSDAGVISQIPVNRLTLMSSGRSNVISCGDYGSIEFVHTSRKAADLAPLLTYDSDLHLWRASVALALRDIRITRRDTGLVQQEVVHESV